MDNRYKDLFIVLQSDLYPKKERKNMDFSTALIFLLSVLDILVYYLLKQHEEDDTVEQNNSSLSSPIDQQSLQEESNGRKNISSSSLLDKWCPRFSLSELKLATNDFDDAFLIGKGEFGKVYKGKIDFGEGLIDVAIKRLNLDSNQGVAEFRAEIEMLSTFRHSHIVSLLGYHEGHDKREMIIVYEYMPNGSLEDHLHKRSVNGSNSSTLTWIERLNICVGAARGLDYLHSGTGVQSRVIHRDIKSSNILLDENLAAKISDFGLSRIGPANLVGTTDVYTDQIKGTFGYMDAEYFSTRRLTRKSDVYAFGVVLLEVLCGRPALDFTLDEEQHSLAAWAKNCIKEGKIDQIIDPSLKRQTTANCLKEFGRIAYECVLIRSKDRPSMSKVVARLEFVLAWTLQSGLSARDRKQIGRTMFIEKAWSLFLIKSPKGRMSSLIKKPGKSINNKKKSVAMASQKALLPTAMTKIPILKMFTFTELQSATRNFRQEMFLGEGGYGKVFKGWLDNVTFAPRKDGDGLAVAIKRSSPNRGQGLNEWQAEVKFLGTFSHPNIVKLFGYCWENKEFLLVYEYMQKGSLDMHLFREGAEPLPLDTRIQIAMGAARGLAFLHATENNVICRDVKSSNILLDKEFNAKLSDFGLAKSGPVKGESHVLSDIVGTFGYMAHEYIATEGRMSATKKLGKSINNVKKGIMMEKHATTFVEGGCQSDNIAAASQQVVLPTKETKIPSLKMFTYSELRSASRNFRPDSLLGEGGFGCVYKGWLDSVTFVPRKPGEGLVVAIKRLHHESVQGFSEWQAEVTFLGTFSHPNIVKLIGYCWENKEFLLVYEFMQKGSLDYHLFRRGSYFNPLTWDIRIKLAIGVAQGLAFLHTREKSIIYRDMKLSNILLDKEFNPKLSDFGLARLGPVNGSKSHITTRVMGTYGYMAPEYISTGHLYVKSDVYSFGVVMLEMITGLRVLDKNRPHSQHNLVDWARPCLTSVKKLRKIMDSKLKQFYPLKGAMKVAELILNCLEPEPVHRPSMEKVVARLEEINTIKIKPRKLRG